MSTYPSNEAEYWSERHNAEERERELKADYPLDETGYALLRPKLSKDGNMWCFLHGENLQEGICGFGETVQKAMEEFNINFYSEKLKKEGD